MITWRSWNLGIALFYIPFLDNYQLYSDFERIFYFEIASFSNSSYYPIMQFALFMMLRWENFQPLQLKRSPRLSILWLSKQGSRQVNSFQMCFWITEQIPGVSSVITQMTAHPCSLPPCMTSCHHSAKGPLVAGWLHS